MSDCQNAAAQTAWQELYQRAQQVQRPRVLSPFAEAGGVGAALLAADGSIYTGVCIDMACGLGICAERAAAAQMITCGQSRVLKLAVRMPDGRMGAVSYTHLDVYKRQRSGRGRKKAGPAGPPAGWRPCSLR